MLENLKLYGHENKREFLEVFFTSLVVGILSFYLFVIYGYGSPDALCEGLYYYVDPNWALQCGRWAIRYMNILLGHNVVMPLFIILMHSVFVAGGLLLVKDDLKLKSHSFLMISSAVLTVSPVVIGQMTYQYMTLAYSLSFFLAMAYCHCGRKKGIVSKILAVLSLAVMMGLYQSYIGAAVASVIFIAIIDIFYGDSVLSVLKDWLKYLITGILGCVLDIVVYKADMAARGLEESNRVAEFSVAGIFGNLGSSVIDCFKAVKNYYLDVSLQRRFFYIIFFVVVAMTFVALVVKLVKSRTFDGIIVVILLALITPIGLNIIHVLIPYNDIVLLMQYQNALVIPFGFALLDVYTPVAELKVINPMRVVACLMAGIVVYTYVISANATFESLRISYEAIQTETELILADVYDLEDYQLNSTTIVFAGFPSDANARNYLEIYNYAIGLEPNAAYWDDISGVLNCRRQYLMNYCGVFAGYLTADEYYSVIYSDEFKEMPVWPAEGSVKMINGKAVVKLTETPYGL